MRRSSWPQVVQQSPGSQVCQRGGSPSSFDRILGTRFGDRAVDLVAAGDLGKMVVLQGRDIVAVDLAEAVGHQKRVSADGPPVQTARSMGIVFGDE